MGVHGESPTVDERYLGRDGQQGRVVSTRSLDGELAAILALGHARRSTVRHQTSKAPTEPERHATTDVSTGSRGVPFRVATW